MRIVLDGMGSDTHPGPEVEAAIQAAEKYGDQILLTGPQNLLQPLLDEREIDKEQVRVVDAPQTLEMTDKPVVAAKTKPKSSMAVGMDLVKQGEADAFISAGNTGGALANSLFRLGYSISEMGAVAPRVNVPQFKPEKAL